jgi:alcohol dehydrogenase
MLPMIGVPTTAGTGSEAQSYAIISDPRTHKKMACGDPKAAFRAVILDPRLTLTQPPGVTAAAGYDAIAHAVESFVCTKRNRRSQEISLAAWRLLEAHYERVVTAPDDLDARAAMQLGAFYAGTAIELSILGATHACANPITARYGTTHGNAIAILLPHVVRWNGPVVPDLYAELLRQRTHEPHEPYESSAAEALSRRLSLLAAAGGLPRTLQEAGASKDDLQALAKEASEQWTGTFNPRPFDANGALEIYQCAF